LNPSHSAQVPAKKPCAYGNPDSAMSQPIDDETYAAQLRCPHGDQADIVFAQMQIRNRMLYERCFERIPHDTTLRMLEIGPGDAHWPTIYLQSLPDIHYTGIDYAIAAVESARKNLQHLKPRVRMIHGDVFSNELQVASFDLIISINTLYFIAHLEPVFLRIREMLTQGGQLILGYKPAEEMRQLAFTQYGFNLHTRAHIENALLNSGFKSIDSAVYNDESRLAGHEILNMHSVITHAETA